MLLISFMYLFFMFCVMLRCAAYVADKLLVAVHFQLSVDDSIYRASVASRRKNKKKMNGRKR